MSRLRTRLPAESRGVQSSVSLTGASRRPLRRNADQVLCPPHQPIERRLEGSSPCPLLAPRNLAATWTLGRSPLYPRRGAAPPGIGDRALFHLGNLGTFHRPSYTGFARNWGQGIFPGALETHLGQVSKALDLNLCIALPPFRRQPVPDGRGSPLIRGSSCWSLEQREETRAGASECGADETFEKSPVPISVPLRSPSPFRFERGRRDLQRVPARGSPGVVASSRPASKAPSHSGGCAVRPREGAKIE